MDIKQYIASGILEQYLLGQLSAPEAAEVEQNAETYPEIRAELDRIELALERYALMQGQSPPPGTLSNILDRLEPTGGTTVKPGSGGMRRILLTVISTAAAVALVAAFMLNQRLQEARATLQQQEAQLSAACDTLITERDSLRFALNFLRSYDTRPIVMRGTDLSPASVATVFYNTSDQRALLSVVDLPEPPTGQQYQLWAIVGGQPVDMGVFDIPVEQQSFQSIPYIPEAQAFAVTLEPTGGSEQPTLEQMYVIGNVAAG